MFANKKAIDLCRWYLYITLEEIDFDAPIGDDENRQLK